MKNSMMKVIKNKKLLLIAVILLVIVCFTTITAFGDKSPDKTVDKVKIDVIEDVDKIPAAFVDNLEDINLFKITITYEDKSKTEMTMFDKNDGNSVWMDTSYEDSEDEEGNITRTYYFSLFYHSVLNADVPVYTGKQILEFKVSPEKMDTTSELKFDVTKDKNWQLMQITPTVDGFYRLGSQDNDKVKLYVFDGENVIEHELADNFLMQGGIDYTVLVVYDLTDDSENTTAEESADNENTEVIEVSGESE